MALGHRAITDAWNAVMGLLVTHVLEAAVDAQGGLRGVGTARDVLLVSCSVYVSACD